MPSQASQMMLDAAKSKLHNLRAAAAQPPQPAPAPVQAQQQPPPVAAAAEPELLTLPPLPEDTAPLNALPADPQLDPAKIEHRVRTIEGVLEAERRQAAEDVRRAAERESRLIEQRDALQAQLEQATAPPPVELRLEDYFSEEDIAELGAEVLMKQLRATERITEAKVEAKIAAKVKPLQDKLKAQEKRQGEDEEARNQRARSQYIAALSAAVPKWETWATKGKNLDPRFHSWLDGDVYGIPRHELLAQADARLDAPAVIRLLKDFLTSLGKTPVTPARDALRVPDGRPAGEDPPPPPSQFDIKESDITKFQSDVVHGLYKGRGRAMLDMQERIRNASAKGRVQMGA